MLPVAFIVRGDSEESAIAGQSRVTIANRGQFVQLLACAVKPGEPGNAVACRLKDHHAIVRDGKPRAGKARVLLQFLLRNRFRWASGLKSIEIERLRHEASVSDIKESL